MPHSDVAARSSPLLHAEHPWGDPVFARIYDHFPFDADAPFYLELATSQGGDVLELACGSGRLLVPLAEAGLGVVGIDSSLHMLALAQQKLEALGDTPARWRLVQGDIESFDLSDRFDLAIIAVKSFAYLTDRARQQRALRTIFEHLRPGGIIALDLLNPSPDWLMWQPGTLHEDLVQETPGGVTVRTEAVVSTDLAAQIRVIRSTYDLIDAGGNVNRRMVEWPFRFTYRFEAELLLESVGFQVAAVYGGYEKEPFASDSRVMMLLGRVPT